MSNEKKGTSGQFISGGAAIILAIIVLAIGVGAKFVLPKLEGNSHQTLAGTPLPEGISIDPCVSWNMYYTVINHQDFRSRTLRIDPGREWLIKLQPNEETGWIRITPSHTTYSNLSVQITFSDSVSVTHEPDIPFIRSTNTFRLQAFEKEVCMLIVT